MPRIDRLGQLGIATGVVLLVALPTALHGWPATLRGNVLTCGVVVAGCALMWWRDRPRVAATLALGLGLAAMAFGDGWFPDTGVAVFSAAFGVLALGWSGPAAWLVALCGLAYLVPFHDLSGRSSWVAPLMFTVPPYVAGTVLRLRNETAHELAARAQELEEEREIVAEMALRRERARIASELHDIVGHAISVMVIQAAAGQRLADVDPERAKDAFAAIAESARQGTQDLERLIDLLAGSGGWDGESPGLSALDELVTRATRSGLKVTLQLEGSLQQIPDHITHVAFRVVQESLTNALRHAPGAEVRIQVRLEKPDGGLDVQIENDRAEERKPAVAGTGQGLIGLRERIQTLGGSFRAGRTPAGGWVVEAKFPACHHQR